MSKKIIIYVVLCSLMSALCFDDYAYTKPARSSTYKSRKAIGAPDTFGKTHFIVGFPPEYMQRIERVNVVSNQAYNYICKVFFSPKDNPQQKLIQYINQEKEAIYIAVFSFTDKMIADALLKAHQRGIHIELIVDPGFLSDRFSRISYLKKQGVPIYIYDPKQLPKNKGTYASLMHNKFVLFAYNEGDGPLVWTGSFNLTKSAGNNQENVVVLNHNETIKEFKTQFQELKKRSIPYYLDEDKKINS